MSENSGILSVPTNPTHDIHLTRSRTDANHQDNTCMVWLLLIGLLLNITSWYHPLFFMPVVVFILIALPVFLFFSISRPHYLLWFILVLFFTQYTVPNNVTYETYVGYEKPTIYFHSFVSFLSVFDIVILSSVYILILRGLMHRTFQSLFSKRWEYYAILGICLISLILGFYFRNDSKQILAEFQCIVYAVLMYFIIQQTVHDATTLRRTVLFVAVLLAFTVPIEFCHYYWINYHTNIYTGGRIRRVLFNSITDNFMVLPTFVFLSCATAAHWTKNSIIRWGMILGFTVSILVIFLNTAREILLLTGIFLILFLFIRRFSFRIYFIFALLVILFTTILNLLQPEHLEKLTQNFSSSFLLFSDYRKDPSIWDRVAEFTNVSMTLHQKNAMLFGLGWGGKWNEYIFQPGRGSLASYHDKTLTSHQYSHDIISYLLSKCGFLGMGILVLGFLSLLIHYGRVYKRLCDHHLKVIMLGLLITYPIYLFFSLVMQLCIAFGIVIGLLQRFEFVGLPPKISSDNKK